jgi:hypothetical protein
MDRDERHRKIRELQDGLVVACINQHYSRTRHYARFAAGKLGDWSAACDDYKVVMEPHDKHIRFLTKQARLVWAEWYSENNPTHVHIAKRLLREWTKERKNEMRGLDEELAHATNGQEIQHLIRLKCEAAARLAIYKAEKDALKAFETAEA